MNRVLRSSFFWMPFGVTLVGTGAFFAWQLGLLQNIAPWLLRPPANTADIVFTLILALLLSLTSGLAFWNAKMGSCPRGVKSASGIAGLLGAFTLFCPACIVLPASLLGVGFVLTFLTPFLPLLRVIAIVLLGTSVWMLWPRKK